MARVYASEGQLTAWLGTTASPPADPVRALRAASLRVDELLLSTVYDTDEAGLPTDPLVAAALADATCAQVEYAMSIGDPYGTGGTTVYKSVQVGAVKLDRAETTSAPAAAFSILRTAGLTGGEPWGY